MDTKLLNEPNNCTKYIIEILTELACDIEQNLLKEKTSKAHYFGRLKKVYKPLSDGTRYRHSYADIFLLISDLDRENETASIDILAQNMQTLYEYTKSLYDKSNTRKENEIILSIQKLNDHVNLDVARINYIKAIANKTEVDSKRVNSKLKELGKTAEKIRKVVQTSDEKVNNMQKEYITILGIFAAIVLAFTSGIVFSSSVLENMHKVSLYNAIIVSLCIGFVLFNVIALLVYELKEIYNENKKNHLLFYVGNIFIIFSIVVVFVLKFSSIEYKLKREKDILEKVKVEQQIEKIKVQLDEDKPK